MNDYLSQIPTMTDGDQIIFNAIEFPQANDLRKVLALCDCFDGEPKTAEEIAGFLSMVPREGSYYGLAACSLRVARKRESAEGSYYELTSLGESWVAGDSDRKQSVMIERTLDSPHVKYVGYRLGESIPLSIPCPQSMLNLDTVAAALTSLPKLGAVTQSRRASTIVSWMRTLNSLR